MLGLLFSFVSRLSVTPYRASLWERTGLLLHPLVDRVAEPSGVETERCHPSPELWPGNHLVGAQHAAPKS